MGLFPLHGRRGRRNVSFVVLVGLVSLVAVLLVGDARSAYDDAQLIAFTRPDGIYVIRADGRGERPLRRGGDAAGAVGLAWSPDGRKLAFTTYAFGGGIWVMNADGSGLVHLVDPARISMKGLGEPSWSPLGQRIAFTALRGKGRWDVWVVNADGTNLHRMLRLPRPSLFQMDWSQYGNRIALTEAGWFMRIYVTNTNGTRLHAINPGPMYEAAMAHWSPQGQRLAYMAWPESSGSLREAEAAIHEAEIWVLDVKYGYAQRLTHNTVIDSNPAWSPDGSRIVFLRGRGEDMLFIGSEKRSPGEIYVMNADGTGVRRLTHNQVGEGSPAWQPGPTR